MITKAESEALERLRKNDYFREFVPKPTYAECSAAMNRIKLDRMEDEKLAVNAMLRIFSTGARSVLSYCEIESLRLCVYEDDVSERTRTISVTALDRLEPLEAE